MNNVNINVDKNKVLRGLADVDAGRTRLAREFFAEMKERRKVETISSPLSSTSRN